MTLRAPKDIFRRIANLVSVNADKLSMDNYHSRAFGAEATTLDQIMCPRASHCLIGLVLLHTPGGIEAELKGEDPLELANDALEAAGKLPLPWGIVMGSRADALKLICGRAAEEMALEVN